MDFIDNPNFGHRKFKLHVFLVPIVMFAVLGLGIWVSKLYVEGVQDHHSHSESP